MADASGNLPGNVAWSELRPYISLVVLECTTPDPVVAFDWLINFLQNEAVKGVHQGVDIVAYGAEIHDKSPISLQLSAVEVDQAFTFVTRTIDSVGWIQNDIQFLDTSHLLTLAIRKNRLVGIHAFDSLRHRLQLRLDREPIPPVRRISPTTLENAFLRGEAKHFWLRGTHPRRATRPDSKNIGGLRLQEAINPIEDSTFALGSARAALDEQSVHDGATVLVGTTMHKSSVWVKPSTTFQEYLAVSVQLFGLLEEVLSVDLPPERLFPLFAYETTDITEVRGAFDISVLTPEELISNRERESTVADVAELLRDAIIEIRGDLASSRFKIDVGYEGCIGGTISVRLERIGEVTKLHFGIHGQPSNEPPVSAIRRGLEMAYRDLVSVHYRSGHTYVAGRIWHRQMQIARFPQWRFEDFSGYDIDREKPLVDKGVKAENFETIHERIGKDGDRSLFAWVLDHYSTGWLTCDDGSGEIADFIHISLAGVLSLIHVKGADSASTLRRISVGAYEVVASQASKNTIYTDPIRLKEKLERGSLRRQASWTDGVRVDSRSDLIEYLGYPDLITETQVIVIQPHLVESRYRELRNVADGKPSDDRLRLQLLETLLNSVRTTVVGSGAELYVVASNA
ncbi:hypothetical protein [Fodinicola feengrottensis]|nr:hypothetical protein [Fodinicola feengrottensis]